MSSRKVRRESSESELRTERDRQEVIAVRAARPADSIFSLDVWNTWNQRKGESSWVKAENLYSGCKYVVFLYWKLEKIENIKGLKKQPLNKKTMIHCVWKDSLSSWLIDSHIVPLRNRISDVTSKSQQFKLARWKHTPPQECWIAHRIQTLCVIICQTDLSAQRRPQSLQEFSQVLMLILWHTSSLKGKNKSVVAY